MRLVYPPLPVLLTFLAIAACVLVTTIILVLVLRAAWRSPSVLALASYFGHSFEDARERPDGKLLTLFNITVSLQVTFAVGWFTHQWPPAYIWITAFGFLAAGYGFSMIESRAKIQAESDVSQAGLTGQPAPGPATATTTTSTTLQSE